MVVSNDKVNITISAKDRATSTMKAIRKSIVQLGTAYLSFRVGKEILEESIGSAADLEANLVSLRSVAQNTGRDYNKILEEMSSRTGRLQSDVTLVESALKGMTTTLTTEEFFNLQDAITNASIAMGQLPEVQIPLIIKALKQLNPNILDNIGVTVRLDEVNKRIRDGFYGANTALNEYTQQHAIYQEVLRQTGIFEGQEEAFLKTRKGDLASLSVELKNLATDFGGLITQNAAFEGALDTAIGAVRGLRSLIGGMRSEDIPTVEDLGDEFETTAEKLDDLNDKFRDGRLALDEYRQGVQAAAEGLETGVGDATQRIVDDILAMTNNQVEATQLLFATFAEKDLPLERFFEAQRRLNDAFEKMRKDAQDYEVEIVYDWKKFWDQFVIEDDTPLQSVERVWETMAGLIKQGFQLPTDYSALETLLESFGFTSEIIAQALTDNTTEALQEAQRAIADREGIAQYILRWDPEAEAELLGGVAEVGEAIKQTRRTDLEDLSQYYQDRQALEDLFFDASLVGKEAHAQELADVDRWYNDQLKFFMESASLSEEERRQAQIALDRIAAERRSEIWRDYYDELDREAAKNLDANERYIKDFQAAFENMTGQYLGRWVDTLVEQKKVGKEFWQSMAQDFLSLFIKTALGAVLNTFLPGLGTALSIFATPKYDALARQEGRDFVTQFWTGAESQLRDVQGSLGSSMAAAATPAARDALGAGQAGGLVQNNYYQGVVTEDFMRADVVPSVALASKRKEVAIAAVTEDRFGGSYVYSS